MKRFTRNFHSFPRLLRNIKIVEVGPRDGLQNEKTILDSALKLQLIDKLIDSGLNVIETTSFVSKKWVPQMADHDQVYSSVYKKYHQSSDLHFPVLVPNLKGLESAIAANVKEIAIFGAASESFSLKNINCSIAESLTKFSMVAAKARKHGIRVRGYVSTVVGCPYEGRVDMHKVVQVAEKMMEMGCYEISLGDTIGIGTPNDFEKLIDLVSLKVPIENIAVHCHDTYGMAIANIYSSLRKGVSVIDSSVGGLGGCPYAKGASGNVATEDVLHLLKGLNLNTNADPLKVAETGAWISKVIGRVYSSKAGMALLKN